MSNGSISYSVIKPRLFWTRVAKFTFGGKATKRGDQNALVCTAAITLVRMYGLCFGAALLTMKLEH